MSSSINLNLTGVGDEFAAAAVEAMRKQQATSESSVLIGKEIDWRVALPEPTAFRRTSTPGMNFNHISGNNEELP